MNNAEFYFSKPFTHYTPDDLRDFRFEIAGHSLSGAQAAVTNSRILSLIIRREKQWERQILQTKWW